MRNHEDTSAKKAWNNTPNYVPNPFQPRPFGIQAESEQSTLLQSEVDAQGAIAQPNSFNFLNIPVNAPGTAPPPPIQTKLTIGETRDGKAVQPDLETSIQRTQRDGQPLADSVRQPMELQGVNQTPSVSEGEFTIQRVYKANDFKTGSASKNKALKDFRKNKYWEVGFRKLTNVAPGAFDPAKENNKIMELATRDIGEGIAINHSLNGIAISRNADFVMDVLRSGNKKVVVIVAIPPNFGVDMEAEYLNYYRDHPDSDRPGKMFPPEYEHNEASKLSMEVTMQRVPTGCVYGWIERYSDPGRGWILKYVNNPQRSCQNIEAIDKQDRHKELISKVKSIKGVTFVNFP